MAEQVFALYAADAYLNKAKSNAEIECTSLKYVLLQSAATYFVLQRKHMIQSLC